MKILIIMTSILGLVLDEIGQFIGYAVGDGNYKEKLSKYEFHRYRHIKPQNI